MKYKRGDILICSTKEMYGQTNHQLIVGEKYKINDSIEISEDRIILDVTHINSNKRIGLVSDRQFISLSSYREWKIKQLIKLAV
jgi:hypothetical protein